MLALLAAFDGGSIVAIGFWTCIAAIVIVPTIAHHWHKTREAELETSLKQEMVARGYSAEEILAVINHDAKSLAGRPHAKSMTPSKLPPESVTV